MCDMVKGRLLESELNGMAIFVMPTNYYKNSNALLLDKAEAAYDEWMSEADEVGDEAICDWIIYRLEQNGFKYEKDYRIFTDLNWD